VALAAEAHKKYAAELANAKVVLAEVAGDLGTVEGRAKDPVSAANRLQRAIDNEWGSAKGGIKTVDGVIDNLWDAVGTRIVVDNGTTENMQVVVKRLVDAINAGKLQVTEAKVGAYVFEVDGAKKLYAAHGGGKAPEGADQLDVRATANHALHPAAVAIARLSFLKALDVMAGYEATDPRRAVFVTNGGCASGKGSLADIVKGTKGGKFEFGAVWDAAGEGDAQENGWILQAAQARGLKVTYGFVESDPLLTYNGVLDRAQSTGRIVDPVTFSRSYVKGQENMRAFLESPEYKAAVDRGEVDAVGVYTGKFDMATKSFPDKRMLGDEGRISDQDIKAAPDEGMVTQKAIEIFEAWLKKQQADGKPIDHWIEGGIVNPLKFDPNAGGATDGNGGGGGPRKPDPTDQKQTTEDKAPVQRKATGGASPGGATEIAAQGTAGPAGALPHHDKIQSSFGRHDVSHVRSHVGGDAADASDQLGAKAFATGDAVGFASSPDLHTAAHEAAHVVQQRGGVQLEGGIDEPGDRYEQQADSVADAVVAGRSAEPILDQAGGGQLATSSPAVVQRDTKDKAKQPASDALPELEKGINYAIAADGWSALVRASWVNEDPVARTVEMLTRMQRLGAFPWANPEGLRRAAQHTAPTQTGPTVQYVVNLRTLAMMGLPSMSAAMVAREGDNLVIALRAGNIADESDQAYPLGPEDLSAAFHALETFTQLERREHVRLDSITIRSGIVLLTIADGTLAKIFGRKRWDEWKQQRVKTAPAGGEADKPASMSSELTFPERMRIEKFLRDNLQVTDAGSSTRLGRSLLELVDEIEADPTLLPAIRRELQKGAGSPGEAVNLFNLRNLIDQAKYDRDRTRLGIDKDSSTSSDTKKVDPFEGFDVPARITQKGLVLAGRSVALALELDWNQLPSIGKSAKERDDFAKRQWHAEVEWAFERTDIPDQNPELQKTVHEHEGIELPHTFRLGKGESSGIWVVHAFLRTSHFAPKHVTAPIEVKTEDARMAELRDQAMGDLKPDQALWMNHRFDIGVRHDAVKRTLGGKDPDADGVAISGDLPKDFKVRDPAERAKGRQEEIDRYKKMIEYLKKPQADGKVGYQDAVNAAEARLKHLQEADGKVVSDQSNGWQSFELRGTYLSRNGEVPSGPLDLYGAVSTETKVAGAGMSHKYKVKIRDLSNKIESDLEFDGEGEFFDQALESAFVDLCKTYPEGKLTVLGQDMVTDIAFKAKPNGRMIGYELPTTSAWKRFKSKVYDPAVQILTSAAAMAVMIVFPPSAAFIVPILAATSIINSVDDMYTRHTKGKDSFKTDVIDLATIGLDLLPAARSAKFLNPSKAVLQEIKATGRNWRLVAFDAVSNAAEIVVMTEQIRDELAEIQDKQIGGMAERYQKMVELQSQNLNDSDPRLATMRAEIDRDAKAIRDTTQTTWMKGIGDRAAFRVGAHMLGPKAADFGDTHPSRTDHDAPQADVPAKPPTAEAPPKTGESESPATTPDAPAKIPAKEPAKAPEVEPAKTTTPAGPKRVDEPVPGLYDSIDPKGQPPGWTIDDKPPKHNSASGTVKYRTEVVAPDGSSGYIERTYDPKTGTLVMENAFLTGLPKWVDMGVPMSPGKGTPTITYLTVRQMKQMKIQFGSLKKVKMSTIQNVEAVMQLEQMKRSGKTLAEAIPNTHSVKYATTTIEQSGHAVGKIKADMTNAFPWKLSDMMDHFGMAPVDRQALFKAYKLGPDDTVTVNYDILIDVSPHPKNP